jgi:GntR family transcriptional regulator / MocR family aminotransferase
MEFILPYETYLHRGLLKSEALYHALKDAVMSGKLQAGTVLPSSRELAKLYGISRGTVNTVYETLCSEGYLSSEVGRGTRVVYHRSGTDAVDAASVDKGSFRLSEWGSRLQELPLQRLEEEEESRNSNVNTLQGINFGLGKPDLRTFPYEQWNRFLYAEVRGMGEHGYREPFQSGGHRSLREAVATYLSRARGLAAQPEQVVIVNGSMQAIALVCQLMINPGDRVIVEDPCYSGIRRAVAAQGGQSVPVRAGKGFSAAVRKSDARLVFVSPGRQFPTGAVLPMAERLELLSWASHSGAVIVEDDYDSEFRHRGRPLEPLKALDRTGSVVYLGTFSKTLPPGHRIGYALLPQALAESFVRAKQLYEPHPTALLEQRALARFIQTGQYERHLRRMKRVYGSRFHYLKNALETRLGGCLALEPSDCGLHLFAWWKGTEAQWVEFRESCRRIGVFCGETETYFADRSVPSACFGFSHLKEEELEEGVSRLEQAWQSICINTIESGDSHA